jgi:hypothetical protein
VILTDTLPKEGKFSAVAHTNSFLYLMVLPKGCHLACQMIGFVDTDLEMAWLEAAAVYSDI